jgi:predicted transcriptional regulator
MDEQAEWTKIAELTTEIVTAYVSSHKLQVLDVPDVIKAVGAGLASLGTAAGPTVLEKPEPACKRASFGPTRPSCLPDLRQGTEAVEAPPRGGARAYAQSVSRDLRA